MLIRLLYQKAVGKDVYFEETIGEYEGFKVPEALFESNGSMRHGCKAWWVTTVLKETHLKMMEKLLEIGWKMGSTHLEPVSFTVPPLPELTQWYTSCVSPANAFVIVQALNSNCRVVLLASAKGHKMWVGNTCSDSC